MQWSCEVLPEPAMVPDLGVFLRSASASAQAVTASNQYHLPPAQSNEVRAVLLARACEAFPARLKLPFLLLPPGGEQKAPTEDPQSVPSSTCLDGR